MKRQHIIRMVIVGLTMIALISHAQQNQSLAKIRVDDKGNIETLDKKETAHGNTIQHKEIQSAMGKSSSLLKLASLADLYYYDEGYNYTYPNLQVYAYIGNNGTHTSGGFRVRIFLKSNNNSEIVTFWEKWLGYIKPGEYKTCYMNEDFSECGNWSVQIVIDFNNDVPESDEKNNDGIIGPPLYINEGCYSDLQAGADVFDTQGPVIEFETVSSESGNCPFTVTHDVAVYLSTDKNITSSDYLIQTWTAYSGIEREVWNWSGPFTIPDHVPAGEYYLGVWVDVNNVVAETDENNNTAIDGDKITIPGSPVTKPDLIVTSVSVTDGSGPGIAYQFSVKNQGNASTGEGFRSDIYLSSDPTITSDDYKINEKNFSKLGAGATHNSGAIQTTVESVPAGDYYLGVIADGSKNISESNESNNTGYAGSPKVNMPEGYEEPDEPAGNLVSNWSFSNDMTDWTFATQFGGNATGIIKNGVFHTQITNGGWELWQVCIYQDDLTIVNGKTYTVTFQARADESRDTWATVGTGSEPFLSYNSNWVFPLSADWQTYTYTFTMGYSTNPNARIAFNFGISSADVYLDNISIVELPDESEEPDQPAGNMVSNWSFSNGMNDWTFNTAESGNAEGKVEDDAFHAQITNGGGNAWNVALYKNNLNIVNGKTYTVSFDARADGPRNILASVAMGVSPFYLYNFEPDFSITTEWKTYTFTFTMGFNSDPAARMGFDLGASAEDVYLDNISLVDVSSSTDVDLAESGQMVRAFELCQNYPNPFNPCTIIRYRVPKSCHVNLTIYDLLGKKVTTLVNNIRRAGEYRVVWDGQCFATGIYLIRMTAGDYIETRKLILQK